MYYFEYSLQSNISKEKIWKVWIDVQNWNKWDHEIEYSELDSEFKVGTKGIMKAKGGPKTNFIISNVEPNYSFSDRTKLPFCNLDFHHRIEESSNEIKLTHRVEFTGLLAFFFSKVIGSNINKNLPTAMTKLIERAKQI
jgi:hypothetical protein